MIMGLAAGARAPGTVTGSCCPRATDSDGHSLPGPGKPESAGPRRRVTGGQVAAGPGLSSGGIMTRMPYDASVMP